MKMHIVQVNERLEDIARKYEIDVKELIKHNQQISSQANIMPGMMLKLPILSESTKERLRENTLNIHEYYPTLEDYQKSQPGGVVQPPTPKPMGVATPVGGAAPKKIVNPTPKVDPSKLHGMAKTGGGNTPPPVKQKPKATQLPVHLPYPPQPPCYQPVYYPIYQQNYPHQMPYPQAPVREEQEARWGAKPIRLDLRRKEDTTSE